MGGGERSSVARYPTLSQKPERVGHPELWCVREEREEAGPSASLQDDNSEKRRHNKQRRKLEGGDACFYYQVVYGDVQGEA